MVKYGPGTFARLIGKTVNTLQRWDRDGVLIASRTEGGRRFYTHDHLIAVKSLQKAGEGAVFGYCRSLNKDNARSLKLQQKMIRTFAKNNNITIDQMIEDTDIEGKTLFGPGLMYLIECIELGVVSQVIVLHRDRIGLIGTEVFESCCKRHRTKLMVLSDQGITTEGKYTKEELEYEFKKILIHFNQLSTQKMIDMILSDRPSI